MLLLGQLLGLLWASSYIFCLPALLAQLEKQKKENRKEYSLESKLVKPFVDIKVKEDNYVYNQIRTCMN